MAPSAVLSFPQGIDTKFTSYKRAFDLGDFAIPQYDPVKVKMFQPTFERHISVLEHLCEAKF